MYTGRVIDCDVHHGWASEKELYPFLPQHWCDYLASAGAGATLAHPATIGVPLAGGSNKRLDAFPPSGGPPGSDYDWTREQLLDPSGLTHALLTFDIGMNAGVANPLLAVELARAINDWNQATWLNGRDDRLHGAILVPPERPEDGAREIYRWAEHPRMAAVLLATNPIGRPFGHPFYDPIYAAAADVGLPVCMHVGTDGIGRGRHAAGGNPNSRLEQFVTNSQPGMHHASSLITHATFEKFPTLRVCFTEWGFGWVPWLFWNLDGQFDLLRRENPRLRRRPSEVLRQHMRFSTQPFDYTDERSQLIELLEAFGDMEQVLMFASDYPHWDGDEADQICVRLPDSWHARVMHDNAAEWFGFGAAVEDPLMAPGAAR